MQSQRKLQLVNLLSSMAAQIEKDKVELIDGILQNTPSTSYGVQEIKSKSPNQDFFVFDPMIANLIINGYIRLIQHTLTYNPIFIIINGKQLSFSMNKLVLKNNLHVIHLDYLIIIYLNYGI